MNWLWNMFASVFRPRKPDAIKLLKQIMATQNEIAEQLLEVKATLAAVGVEVDKVSSETSTLQAKIVELEKVITDGAVSPELQAAFDAVKEQAGVVAAKVKAADDQVPG